MGEAWMRTKDGIAKQIGVCARSVPGSVVKGVVYLRWVNGAVALRLQPQRDVEAEYVCVG